MSFFSDIGSFFVTFPHAPLVASASHSNNRRVEMRKFGLLGGALLMMLGACAQTQQAEIPPDALEANEAFVPIAKADTPSIGALRGGLGVYAGGGVISPGNGNDFYLAINKNELGKKWFL